MINLFFQLILSNFYYNRVAGFSRSIVLLFIVYFILIHLNACKRETNKEYVYTEKLQSTYSTTIKEIGNSTTIIKNIQYNNLPYIATLNITNSKYIYLYSEKFELLDSIILPVLIKSKLVLDFTCIGKKIIFLNTLGEIIQYEDGKITINKLPQNVEYFANSDFFPLLIFKNKLLVNTYPNEVLDTEEKQRKYLKMDNIKLINLNNILSIADSFGAFPSFYTKSNLYYSSNCNRQIVDSFLYLSYQLSDSIYRINLLNHKKDVFKFSSNHFVAAKTFDFSKINDITYISKHQSKYSTFFNLLYNPYTQNFYRVIVHKNEKNPKGADNYDWSIVVSNKELTTKYEVFFPANKYENNYILLTSTGVALPRLKKEEDEKIIYDTFDLR